MTQEEENLMPFLPFEALTPSQQVAAQLQLDRSVVEPSLKRLHLREFLVVDGTVRGSRLRWTDRDRRLLDALGVGRHAAPSRGSLQGWTGGPRRWSLDP